MAKIPIILEPGRADGKLATSGAIFDENKGTFQSEINDIQDTLNSDNPNKPLSAKQGKILKELLDNKVIEAGGIPIDTEPIEGNITHLVNSDGLAKEFNKHNTAIIQGNVYDVSFYNNCAVFDSIQSLLSSSNLSTLIPTSVRHGGMTIRFIQGSEQSSDNKYVQYCYMGTATTGSPNPFLDTANWQGVDDEPTIGSNNLVKSGGIADSINKLKNAGYLYAGIATPTTNPGTPEGPVFYIANDKGTYTNFGGINVTEEEVVVLYYDTIWHKNATGIASNDKLTELESDVDNLNLEVEIAGVSITKYDFNNLQNGQYNITSARIDPVLKQNDNFRGIIFHVNKGDDVVVSTYGGKGGARAWGLASENYTLIARSEENLDCRDDKRVTLHISEDGYCAVNLNTLQENGEHFYVKHIHISDNKITSEIKNDVENITTDLTSLQVDVNNLEEIIEGKGEKQYVYEDLNQSGYYRIMAVGSSPINPVIVQNEYIKGIYFPVKSGDSVVVSSYSNIENGQNCYGITDLSFNTIERASEKDYIGDKAKTLSITQDGYVFVNFFAYQQDTSKFFIKHKYRSNGIIDKVEVVDFLAKVGTKDAEYSIINGKYIKAQSRFLEYVDNASFHCSSPIKLNCGDTIIVESNGANQSIIAQLAECNYSGAPIRSIKNYTKVGVENVEYTAKYSCYVVASWYSLNSIKIKKIISGKLKDFSDALSDVDTYKNNVSRLVDFTENPIAKIRREAGFTSIIRNWGFIGDSLSSGVMNYTTPAPAGTVHMYDLSWCQMLCRLTGAEGYNFSYGGQYAKRWVTGKNENGTPNQPERCWEGAKVNPKDGYIIALGENDKDPAQQAIYGCGNVATDVGTYNPETDTDTNANSYAGWMAGIIQRIKSIQPKAPIFIINLPKNPAGTTREEYNKVISDLCDKFNGVYLIDLYKYAPDFYYEPNFHNTYFHPSHMTALGYQWIAWTICTYIDWIIRNNMHDFANQQFVGTQYWHD